MGRCDHPFPEESAQKMPAGMIGIDHPNIRPDRPVQGTGIFSTHHLSRQAERFQGFPDFFKESI